MWLVLLIQYKFGCSSIMGYYSLSDDIHINMITLLHCCNSKRKRINQTSLGIAYSTWKRWLSNPTNQIRWVNRTYYFVIQFCNWNGVSEMSYTKHRMSTLSSKPLPQCLYWTIDSQKIRAWEVLYLDGCFLFSSI